MCISVRIRACVKTYICMLVSVFFGVHLRIFLFERMFETFFAKISHTNNYCMHKCARFFVQRDAKMDL